MPATSQQQQKLFGLALAFKRGEVPASEVSDEIKAIADRMSEKDIEDFAATKHKGLPKMKEQLRKIVRETMRESVLSSITEGRYDADLDKIEAAVKNASSFMNVGSELKKIGVKYDFSTSMIPMYRIKVSGNTIAIVNKKYAAGAEREVKDIAIGLMENIIKESLSPEVAKHMGSIHKGFKMVEDDGAMVYDSPTNAKKAADFLNSKKIAASFDGKYVYLESVNEAFKHLIHVDTPTQVVSKPVAAQIMALAKKGIRSKDIGLEMGFTGNAKLAADTFQKVKSRIYFELDKRESVNEVQYKDAVAKFNDELIKHPMVKKVAQHYKKTPAEIVKVLQQRLSTKGNRGGDTKEVSINFKDTDSGITIKHKTTFNESVVTEAAGKEAMGIAALTATRGDAVQAFIDKHNLDGVKLFKSIKSSNLQGKMNFVSALVGHDGNPNQRLTIKLHQKK